MHSSCLVRYAEIGIKGGNRVFFERRLVQNIKACLNDNNAAFEGIERMQGRIIVHGTSDYSCLKYVFGIASFSHAERAAAGIAAVKERALAAYKNKNNSGNGTFRVTAQRLTKDFPLTSGEIEREVGAFIVEKTGAKVSLKSFGTNICIEIIGKDSYIFTEKCEGLGGLPLGMTARVFVLLESEASILAAFLMMKRGSPVMFVKMAEIDYGRLEKYSCGEGIELASGLPKDAGIVVNADTIESMDSESHGYTMIMPLIGYSDEEIKEKLSAL